MMALQEELEEQGLWLFRYRSYLPVIILLGAFVVHFFEAQDSDIERGFYDQYFEFFCLGVSLVGLAIRIYAVGFTPKNTSGRNTAEGQVADTLNTSGIYSLVRHPLYLGNFFMWLGPAILVGNLWFTISFVFAYWVYYERIMFGEEQFLRRKFGQPYVDWSLKTPAFVPKTNGFIPSHLHFSWKKVLKKEKNGILALFVIFLIFNYIGEWNNKKPDYNDFLIYGTVVSLLIYIILKYLKSYTSVLDEEGR